MKILICDDSPLARKAITKTIESYSSDTILFAEHGAQALELLKTHSIDVLFLDLTMPVMDGFEVLAQLPVNAYPTKTVVVSGDVQQKAMERCYSLGACDFVKKPFDQSVAKKLFQKLGIEITSQGKDASSFAQEQISSKDKFKELTNIALGRTAAVLSDFIGEFIHLPIPYVNPIEPSELKMMIQDVLNRDSSIAVAQRFVGGGVIGEAIVCMRGSDIARIGAKLGFNEKHSSFNEIVLNISNLLVSSFLNSLELQMNIDMALRQPVMIDAQTYGSEKYEIAEKVFTIEFIYKAERLNFSCEVLFLFDQQSENVIYSIMESF